MRTSANFSAEIRSRTLRAGGPVERSREDVAGVRGVDRQVAEERFRATGDRRRRRPRAQPRRVATNA